MQRAGPGGHPAARRVQRVGVVLGALVELALGQPDGLALEDVDRREEDHRRRAARATRRPGHGTAPRSCPAAPARRARTSRGETGPRARCRAPTIVANALAVLGGGDDVGRILGPRRQRVHVVEGAALAGQSRGERRRALEADVVPADVRDPQPAGVQRAHLAGEQPEAVGELVLLGALEQQLHAQADAQHGRAGRGGGPDALVEAELDEVAHALRERPDARDDERVGRLQRRRVARDERARADVLQRLLHRSAVAHPVVDDRHRRHVSVPLVLGTPFSVGSRATAARSARAQALNVASITWWALVPASTVRCSVSLALAASARKNSSVELVVEVADRSGRQRRGEGQQPAAGDVDGAGRPALVHRDGGLPVAVDARAIAERLVQRLAEADPDVLDGVVRAGLQVAAGPHGEIEAAVARQQVQHVIEEADAGVALALAVAVQRQRQVDVGLSRCGGRSRRRVPSRAIVANASLQGPGVQLEALGPGDGSGGAWPARRRRSRSAPR